MKILNRLYLLLAIFMVFIGIIQFIRWNCFYEIKISVCIFLFSPAIAFLLAYIFNKKTQKMIFHGITIFLCLFGLFLWSLISMSAETWRSATTEITNVRKYDEILKLWDKDLVSHFPRPIPPDISNVSFSSLPKFLQGGAHVQLRYSASAQQISELYDGFTTKKTKSFFGGDKNDHVNMHEGAATTFFYTSGSSARNFPDDYEILVFDKVIKEENKPTPHWNHGISHGVAISKKRNTIVYWAEAW